MRKFFIAGNWKMNMGPKETASFFRELATLKPNAAGKVDAAICPPTISLAAASDQTQNGINVTLGAQNVHYEENGAFTGEVSTSMLKEIGCKYVIVGHSERRQFFGETDAIINRKVIKCLADDVTPIVCVGELLGERKEGAHFDVVKLQIADVLKDLTPKQVSNLVIAYEPVWAIGTGETASPEQAQEMHAFIRKELVGLFNDGAAQKIRILYGGSMKPANAEELLKNDDVDGGLIGGASLKPDSFTELITIAESVSQ
ncbi:MAG: triose-phosphate isomerase [Balneolales bacterium]